jgi:hypothetical protein
MWKYEEKHVRVWLSGSAVDVCTAAWGINTDMREKNENKGMVNEILALHGESNNER